MQQLIGIEHRQGSPIENNETAFVRFPNELKEGEYRMSQSTLTYSLMDTKDRQLGNNEKHEVFYAH